MGPLQPVKTGTMAHSIDSGPVQPRLMDRVCAELVDVEMVSHSVAHVSGECFIELFAGCCCLTLGCLFASVPCVKPWDLAFGSMLDVVVGKPRLLALAKTKRIRAWHMGTSSRSNTWARDPPLSSAADIWGLPYLTENQQSIVDLGNQLVEATVDIAWAVWEAGCYFSIENP